METFGFNNIANIHPVSTLTITKPITLTIHPIMKRLVYIRHSKR